MSSPLRHAAAWAAALALSACGSPAPPAPSPDPVEGAPSTVVLVVLDTTRADRLGAYGGPPGLSPSFDSLAAEGRLYEQAWALAPWTLPSHATLFTGLPPWEHGATHASLALPADRSVLAEEYTAAGYRTAGFSNNPWVGAAAGLDRGFETYVEVFARSYRSGTAINRFIDPAGIGMDDSGAARTVAAFDDWLGQLGDEHGFAFVNLIEAHLPYEAPEGWLGRRHPQAPLLSDVRDFHGQWLQRAHRGELDDSDRARALRLYDEEVAYVDHQLGRLVESLRRHERLDDALVVVTADHGEAFGDASLEGVDLVDHQLSVRDELLRVPLVVHWPKRVPPGREPLPVSHLDLTSTLRWALQGAEATDPGLLGPRRADAVVAASYSPPSIHEPVLAAYVSDPDTVRRFASRGLRAVRQDGWKLVVPTDGPAALYHVAVDPLEQTDLASSQPERVRALESLLPPEVQHGSPGVGQDVAEALRVLGYVR